LPFRLAISRLRTLPYAATELSRTWWTAWTRTIPKWNRRHETPRRKLEDNIKMYT
jgi:hypothetical protein